MLECYIIEFSVECDQYFLKAEAVFRFGLWGKLPKEVISWIKILVVEEGLLVFKNPITAS